MLLRLFDVSKSQGIRRHLLNLVRGELLSSGLCFN